MPRSRAIPSVVKPDLRPLTDLGSLDKQLAKAGLKRASRDGRPSRLARLEQVLPEELAQPAADPGLSIAPNGVGYLPVKQWDNWNWLWHGFSTRLGGLSRAYAADGAQADLNLGFTAEDDPQVVSRNRELLVESVTGSAGKPLATVRQIHSNRVVVVDAPAAPGQKPPKADGLMTDTPGLLLAVMTADCIPVLVADRKRKAVAAFHAGWRGTVRRIVEAGIGRMRMEFGSRPEDLSAAIGPGIGQCCYSVGEEVLSEFESQFAYARELFVEVDETDPVRAKYVAMFLNQRAPGHGPRDIRLHLSVAEANRRQLLAAGVKPGRIEMVGGCTSCRQDLYFSHRASKGRAGRMMSVIGIRP